MEFASQGNVLHDTCVVENHSRVNECSHPVAYDLERISSPGVRQVSYDSNWAVGNSQSICKIIVPSFSVSDLVVLAVLSTNEFSASPGIEVSDLVVLSPLSPTDSSASSMRRRISNVDLAGRFGVVSMGSLNSLSPKDSSSYPLPSKTSNPGSDVAGRFGEVSEGSITVP